MKVDILKDPDGKEKRGFVCPGCEFYHVVIIKGNGSPGPVWGYNGNEKAPTFSPSLLVRWVSVPDVLEEDENGKLVTGPDGKVKGAKNEICHSFIREGKIQFLNDCTHKLKGQTVELNEIK